MDWFFIIGFIVAITAMIGTGAYYYPMKERYHFKKDVYDAKIEGTELSKNFNAVANKQKIFPEEQYSRIAASSRRHLLTQAELGEAKRIYTKKTAIWYIASYALLPLVFGIFISITDESPEGFYGSLFVLLIAAVIIIAAIIKARRLKAKIEMLEQGRYDCFLADVDEKAWCLKFNGGKSSKYDANFFIRTTDLYLRVYDKKSYEDIKDKAVLLFLENKKGKTLEIFAPM